MNHLDIDWAALAERMPAWRELRPETRHYLLAQRSADRLRAGTLGEELDRLRLEGFVHVASTGTITLAADFRPHHRALRAMERNDLVMYPDSERLHDYLVDQFTAADRAALLADDFSRAWGDTSKLIRMVTSAAWIRAVLEPSGPSTPAGDFGGSDTATLVQEILDRGGAVELDEVFRLLADRLPAHRLDAAIHRSVSRVHLLATVPQDTLVPTLLVWPSAAERLGRPALALPAPVAPSEEAGLPFLLHDIQAVLIEASSEPLRLRSSDERIFARAQARIEAALAPLPALLALDADWPDEDRVDLAIQVARQLKFLRSSGRHGKDLRLQVTPAARDWLGQPLAARTLVLLDLFRHVPLDPDVKPSRRVVSMDDDMGWDDDPPHWHDEETGTSIRLLEGHYFDRKLQVRLEAALVDAFREPPEAVEAAGEPGVLPLVPFAAYHGRNRNPLMDEGEMRQGYLGYQRIEDLTEEEKEAWWTRLLLGVILHRLLPLGGAVFADVDDPPGPGFRLTGAGRYLLGIDEDLPADGVAGASAAEGPAQVVVQPNFEVVFLAPSPAAEAELSRLAERTSAGSVGTLFRITRDATFAAAAAGVRLEEATRILEDMSLHPLPPNVARELDGWFGACRVARAGPAYLLRFPDEESATRALSAAGNAAIRLAPTLIELPKGAPRPALLRKLRNRGIFLDREEPRRK